MLDSQKLKPDAEVQRAAIERHRFQPGRSGNPGGRPKGVVYPAEYLRSLVDMTRSELDQVKDDEAAPAAKRIVAFLVLDAMDGHAAPRVRQQAAAEVMDRTSAKAQQRINVQSDGVQPTLVQIMDGAAPHTRRVESSVVDRVKRLAERPATAESHEKTAMGNRDTNRG